MGEHPGLGPHGTHVSAAWGWGLFDAVVIVALGCAAVGYAVALWAARRRTGTPPHRSAARTRVRVVCWYGGLVLAGAGLVGPLADAAQASFVAHMAAHLLVGMLAPLVLVLAAPVTLALKALPVDRARLLARALRSLPIRAVTHPVVAGALNAGGLWLLYTTDLYRLMHESVWVHAAVHAHLLVAGYIFSASLVGPDPDPHRSSLRLRSGVLIAFMAAHSILAKWLYVAPPTGVEALEGRIGAKLMYFGGDAVDASLIVLLLATWYRATRPRPGRGGGRSQSRR